MPLNAPAQYEHAQVKLSTALSGLVAIAVLALGVYAKANDDAIDRAEKTAEKNASAVTANASSITNLTLLIQANAIQINQNVQVLEGAAANAQANHDALIRIETKLQTEGRPTQPPTP